MPWNLTPAQHRHSPGAQNIDCPQQIWDIFCLQLSFRQKFDQTLTIILFSLSEFRNRKKSSNFQPLALPLARLRGRRGPSSKLAFAGNLWERLEKITRLRTREERQGKQGSERGGGWLSLDLLIVSYNEIFEILYFFDQLTNTKVMAWKGIFKLNLQYFKI